MTHPKLKGLSLFPTQKVSSFLFTGQLIGFIGFSLACFPLPPLRFGYYYQTDSTNCIWWVVGSLSFFWLLWGYFKRPWLIGKCFTASLVWGPFGTRSSQPFLKHFPPFSFMDWVGSPKMGEGILTFFTISGYGGVLFTLKSNQSFA